MSTIATERPRPINRKYRRRPFLLEPGQSLIDAGDPIKSALSYKSGLEALGVPQERLMASRISPLVIPERSGRPGPGDPRRRRIAGVRPEMMWLPLFWLPPRLENRARFCLIDGEAFLIDPSRSGPNILAAAPPGREVHTETDDLWVLRIALELEVSGVYDTGSGTWFDVLDSAGIDVDKPDDVKRVANWMAGWSDIKLDLLDTGFELDSLIADPDDPSWALSSALALHEPVMREGWARAADTLLVMTDDLFSAVNSADPPPTDRVRSALVTVCGLASPWFEWYRARVHDAKSAESAWWNEEIAHIKRFRGTTAALMDRFLPEIIDRLTDIREDCLAWIDDHRES